MLWHNRCVFVQVAMLLDSDTTSIKYYPYNLTFISHFINYDKKTAEENEYMCEYFKNIKHYAV